MTNGGNYVKNPNQYDGVSGHSVSTYANSIPYMLILSLQAVLLYVEYIIYGMMMDLQEMDGRLI